jgi:polar amino acid transport system substrate-binding protein
LTYLNALFRYIYEELQMKGFIVSLVAMILLSPSFSFAKSTIILGQPQDTTAEITSLVLIEAYKRINYHIKFVKLPAERSLIESDLGRVDGEVNRVAGIDKKYTNLIMIPVPVNYLDGVVFTKKHVFLIEGWESLKPYSIAIRTGTKFAEKGTNGMNVVKFVSNDKIFDMVSKGKYDVCVSSLLSGLHQIKTKNLLGINVLKPPVVTLKLYHYLHKKNKNLVPGIRDSLLKMQQEGTIVKIREQFVNQMLNPNPKE